MTIQKYSQYFTITDLNFSKLVFLLHEFNKTLVTYTMKLDKRIRGKQPEVIKAVDKQLYIIETEHPDNRASKNVIRYPISLLDDLYTYLRNIKKLDEVVIVENKIHQSYPIILNINKELIRRTYQIVFIDKITSWSRHNVLVDLDPGYGKEMPIDTPILTPDGWRILGDIKVGDKVTGNDGKPTNVIGVYPQGYKPIIEFTTNDGRVIESGYEHLWKTNRGVRNTKSIMRSLDSNKEVYIPGYNSIGNTSDVKISTSRLNTIIKTIKTTHTIPTIISDMLLTLKYDDIEYVLEKLSTDIIDDEVLFRTEQGILVDALKKIIYKLGYTINIKRNKGVYELAYNRRMRRTYLVSYNILDKSKEAICIAVDNESKLFVVKDYIVTHNTFISMSVISELKRLFAIIVLPRYLEKWINDVLYLTDIKRDEILVIQGGQSLIEAITTEGIHKKYKCYIISLTTIRGFIKSYLTNTITGGLDLSPEVITEALGVDIVLNDESHQEFFNVYNFMLFCNNRLTLGLTATLQHSDKYINKMYEIGFPLYNRISNVITAKKYVDILSIRFRFKNSRMIKFKNHFGYNQSAFEKSIIKHGPTLRNYLDMINSISKNIFFKHRLNDEKMLVFMGTVKMCTIVVDYIQRKHPNIKVTKYTEEDSYSVIAANDFIVSTLGSASTALDIPNLISVLNTVNTDSKQSNTQSKGRLRFIEDKKLIYAYTWSSDIRPHKRYNVNRIDLFKKTSKSVRNIEYRGFI